MKPGTPIDTTAGTLAALTPEQFKALQENILAEGNWDHLSGPIRVVGSDPLSITLGGLMVGIEPDGYTHS